MENYQNTTDEIICGISKKIEEAELAYESLKENRGSIPAQDVTMSKVESNPKFPKSNTVKNFLNHVWKEDMEIFQKAVRREMRNFKKFLKKKKSDLISDLNSEMRGLSPCFQR